MSAKSRSWKETIGQWAKPFIFRYQLAQTKHYLYWKAVFLNEKCAYSLVAAPSIFDFFSTSGCKRIELKECNKHTTWIELRGGIRRASRPRARARLLDAILIQSSQSFRRSTCWPHKIDLAPAKVEPASQQPHFFSPQHNGTKVEIHILSLGNYCISPANWVNFDT